MNSRTLYRRCDAWVNSPVAALRAVLTMLLIAVALCLGPSVHTAAGPHPALSVTAATPVTAATLVAAQAPAGGRTAAHHAVSSARPGDCHSGGGCCARSAHGGPAVVPAAPQPLPVVLPCSPTPARQPVTAHATGVPLCRGAPDLHALNVQRI
ncbi:hypothetical protein QA802_39580 [Streptomyces sp. B21-105]|uniref:hypothetical protein n=1 Tax=Streptomyces sp. B21-105 TaxID=3039417 RepID=UPI002FF1C366